MAHGDGDELSGLPGVVAVVEEPLAEGFALELAVGGVVADAAGVVEELAQGDRGAVVAVALDEAGEVLVDGVVEVDPPLALELEEDGGDEGLGDGADAEAVVGAACPAGVEVGGAGCPVPDPVTVAGAGEGAGEAVGDGNVQDPLGALVAGGGGCGGGLRGQGEGGERGRGGERGGGEARRAPASAGGARLCGGTGHRWSLPRGAALTRGRVVRCGEGPAR